MAEFTFLAVAIEDQLRIGRQYRRHFPEVLREGLRGKVQRVSDMASSIVGRFARVQEHGGASVPELLCLVERDEFSRRGCLLRRGNQRNASRRDLICRQPHPHTEQNKDQRLRRWLFHSNAPSSCNRSRVEIGRSFHSSVLRTVSPHPRRSGTR